MGTASKEVFLPMLYLCGASQEVIVPLLLLAPIPLIVAGLLFYGRQILLGFLVGILLVALMEYSLFWGRERIVSTCMPICFTDQDCHEVLGRWRAGLIRQEKVETAAILTAGGLDLLILAVAAFRLSRSGYSNNPDADSENMSGRAQHESIEDKKSGANDEEGSFHFQILPEEEPNKNKSGG